ncbi:MAG: hypothetical protein AAF555_05740 [Verrucomicrobiota bacterium]
MDTDFLLDLLRAFQGQGMTHAEALEQVEEDDWRSALQEALEEDGMDAPLCQFCRRAFAEQSEMAALEQAMDLWGAGWTSEDPMPTQNEVWQWYWRRPPRGKRKKGKRFLSTNQAWNALQRELKPEF